MDGDKTQEFFVGDITEEKDIVSLRRRLNACEKRYQTLIETNLFGIQVMNTKGKYTYVNAVQAHILEYESRDLEQKHIWDVIPEKQDQKNLMNILSRLKPGGGGLHSWTGDFLRKDGQTVRLHLEWHTMGDIQGEISGYIAVTTRVETEQEQEGYLPGALADTREEKYAKEGPARASEHEEAPESGWIAGVIHHAREMILTIDMEGKILYINSRGEDILGYLLDELKEMNIDDFLPPGHLDQIKKTLLKQYGAGIMEVVNQDVDIINRNLAAVPMEISSSLITERDMLAGILFIGRQNAYQREIAREMTLNAKFDTLSTFALGLITDLQTLVGEAVSGVSAMEQETAEGSFFRKKLTEVKTRINEIKGIIARLRLLTKGGIQKRKSLSVGKLLQDTARRVSSASGIRIKTRIPDSLWPTDMDEEKIRIVIANILDNAVQAVDENAVVRLEADNLSFGPETANPPIPEDSGRFIRISVQDPGKGIPKEVLPFIFDPYYSTKETEKKRGQGFGLPVAYAIVRKHNGYIRVDSRQNIRTVFDIYLPASKPRGKNVNGNETNTRMFSGRILIADPDRDVQEIAGRILMKLGFQVEYAEESEEVLERVEAALAAEKPYHAVILDMGIKGEIDARQLMTRIRKMAPHIPGIVSSLYFTGPDIRNLENYGFSGVIEKPYTKNRMIRLFSDILPYFE